MKIFKNLDPSKQPLVSFVLIDWSCRESFHTLHYLNQQNIPRDQYEIIWIEFFDHKADAIQQRLNEDQEAGRPPSVDQWLALEFSNDLCHHKHLTYNVGITAARGRIITFCDSDAMLKPTFVQSIIDSFDSDKNPELKQSGLVLHCDEVRNNDKKFYPFNFPTFEEVLGTGCINWDGEQTIGLGNHGDPLHHRNYGACMSALKEDLIAIGGADEHLDYIGHVCGPYEMTFRLINAGKRELWHPKEFLFHTWHPGTDGEYDHMGPHDGFNMSSTALASRITRRILPLQENPAIQTLRQNSEIPDRISLIRQSLEVDNSRWRLSSLMAGDPKRTVTASTLKSIFVQFLERAALSLKKHKSLKGLLRAIFYSSFFYAKNLIQQNTQIQVNCKLFLDNLAMENCNEFVIFGAGEVAEHLYTLTQKSPLRIKGVYGSPSGNSFHELIISPTEDLADYSGKVVLGDPDDMESRANILRGIGIPPERIIVLM
jgi:hypothetical protein